MTNLKTRVGISFYSEIKLSKDVFLVIKSLKAITFEFGCCIIKYAEKKLFEWTKAENI